MEKEMTQTVDGHLTFVIRDPAPLAVFNDPAEHRTVQIELTKEQQAKLLMFCTGQSCGRDIWEHISAVYWEPTLIG